MTMFPFEITYKKKLKEKFKDCSDELILDAFRQDFQESGVRILRYENNDKKLVAELEFFAIRPGLNWNRWVGIGQSSVEIIENENNFRIVIYKINLTRLLVVALIVSIIFGIISKIYWIGIIAFGVLGFLNWIVKLVQHLETFNSVFDDLFSKMNSTNGL